MCRRRVILAFAGARSERQLKVLSSWYIPLVFHRSHLNLKARVVEGRTLFKRYRQSTYGSTRHSKRDTSKGQSPAEEKGGETLQGEEEREEKARKGHGNRPNSLMEAGGCRSSLKREHSDHTGHWATRRRLRQIITYFMTFLHRPFNLAAEERGRGGRRQSPARNSEMKSHPNNFHFWDSFFVCAMCVRCAEVKSRQLTLASKSPASRVFKCWVREKRASVRSLGNFCERMQKYFRRKFILSWIRVWESILLSSITDAFLWGKCMPKNINDE